MQEHHDLIEKFYTAFQEQDAETMASCYHEDITFTDPVFSLKGKEVGAMWAMLIERSKGNLVIHFDRVMADESGGFCHWDAHYPFSKTGRKVHNQIKATFRFQDGKIIEHHDHFDFWKWSRMALGLPGILLGWTPMIHNKVKTMANQSLKKYMAG